VGCETIVSQLEYYQTTVRRLKVLGMDPTECIEEALKELRYAEDEAERDTLYKDIWLSTDDISTLW
jgi:hypothetical protein